MELITIKESHYSNDLAILKSRLEAEGIHCVLKDELTSQVLSHIPSISVKLQVYESDLPLVKTIMDEFGEEITIPQIILCPSCNSKEVKVKMGFIDSLKIALVYAASQLSLSKYKGNQVSKDYICQECDTEFKQKS